MASRQGFYQLLIDVQMPVMDGSQATRILRQQGFMAPIIGVSAEAMPEGRQAALDAGSSELHSEVSPVSVPANDGTAGARLAWFGITQR